MSRAKAFVIVMCGTLWAFGMPALAQEPASPVEPPNDYGTTDYNFLVVQPEDFVPLAPGDCTWALTDQNRRLWSVGNAPGRTCGLNVVYAPIHLPTGALIQGVTTVYEDTSASAGIGVTLQRTTMYSDGSNYQSTALAVFNSSGTPGVDAEYVALDPDETVDYIDPAIAPAPSVYKSYRISVGTPLDGSVRLWGIYVLWKRQVSPAPATATFTDVPTTSPFFQYIEALYDTGIIAGCGGGNYCPTDPVNRGQMAVFMAKLLGLHYSP